MQPKSEKGRICHTNIEQLFFKHITGQIDDTTMIKFLTSDTYKSRLNSSFTYNKKIWQMFFQSFPTSIFRKGMYPLQFSLISGKISIIKALLQAGAELRPPLEMIKILLSYAENVIKAKDHQPWLTINIICSLLNRQGTSCIRDFLQLPQHNALRYAIMTLKSQKAVEFLLEQGANINTQDKQGFTPLLTAIASGQIELVKYLCAKEANPKEVLIEFSPGIKRWVSPVESSLSQSIECILFLITYTFNKEGDACAKQLQKVFAYLFIAHKRFLEPRLLKALLDTNLISLRRTELLLDKPVHNKAIDNNYSTPLNVAIADNNLEIVTLLIEYGADQNFYCQGEPALSFACKQDAEEIVYYLLEREDLDISTIQYTLTEPSLPEKYREIIHKKLGLSVNSTDLVEKQHMDIFLSDNIGAFKSYFQQQKDSDIDSLFGMALLHQAEEILTYLLHTHISPAFLMEPYINYQDIAILTPFQYAVFQGNNSIIRLLSLFCLKKSKEDFSAHLEACKTLWLSLPNTEKKAQCLQILETIASYCKPGEAKEWGHTFFDGARGTRYTKEVHKLSYKDIKQNTIIISPSSLEPLESTSLPLSFQGKILDESALKQVETENSRMYAWLDREALGTTETSLYLQERFYERRLILDEDCLKHISSSGKLTACIKIEGKSYQFSYEFELKQYGTPARILFCQLPLDHQRGSLLVGLHFAPKGLHEKNAIYSLVESAAAKVIAVSLPFIKPPALSISI